MALATLVASSQPLGRQKVLSNLLFSYQLPPMATALLMARITSVLAASKPTSSSIVRDPFSSRSQRDLSAEWARNRGGRDVRCRVPARKNIYTIAVDQIMIHTF